MTGPFHWIEGGRAGKPGSILLMLIPIHTADTMD
jgi:hypothetical protein